MNKRSTFVPKLCQLVSLQTIPADQKPYLVRGMPDTLLYLTSAQAAIRQDLIPQFKALSTTNEPIIPAEWVESDRW